MNRMHAMLRRDAKRSRRALSILRQNEGNVFIDQYFRPGTRYAVQTMSDDPRLFDAGMRNLSATQAEPIASGTTLNGTRFGYQFRLLVNDIVHSPDHTRFSGCGYTLFRTPERTEWSIPCVRRSAGSLQALIERFVTDARSRYDTHAKGGELGATIQSIAVLPSPNFPRVLQ